MQKQTRFGSDIIHLFSLILAQQLNKYSVYNIKILHTMDDGSYRPQYQDSLKATDTTGFPNHHSNTHQPTDLFKEDSESSDPPLIPTDMQHPQILHSGEVEHDELRKFMKKADKLNEVNYRKLHLDKSLVPESSSLNIYKSSKNILDEINGQTYTQRRDKQIKQIYLGGKQPKKNVRTSKKFNNTLYAPGNRRKMVTACKQVQTENDNQEELSEKKRQQKEGSKKKKVLLNTLREIEEDDDEDHLIPKRRKPRRHNLNTTSMGNAIDISEFTRPKTNVHHYLQNLSRAEHKFATSLNRYDLKQQPPFKTVYNGDEEPQLHKAFIRPTINPPADNPWDEPALNSKHQSRAENRAELDKQKDSRLSQTYNTLPAVNGNSSEKKIEQEKNSYAKTRSNIQKEGNDIPNSEYEKMPEIPKISTKKKTEGQNSAFQAPTQHSLFVEQNNSEKKTTPSQYSFSINKGHTSTNFYQSKNISPHEHYRNDKKQQYAQIPEIREIAIGTDTNNFAFASKKPVHPININFTEGDAGWITSNYKPKSEFIRKMDMKNFDIKKYRNGVYFGEISEDGLKHGKGVVFYFNGRSYEGSFINDLKEGKGYEYLADGSVYKGEFKNGFKEGKGSFEWPNGEVYDGQWTKGKKSGSGMWKSPNGNSYIGEWKNGKVEGFGVLVVKEGDRYEGEFKNSMKNGYGTQRYANGDTYVGEFSKNRPNGQGQYYYQNGDYFKGIFSNGLKHGDGYFKSNEGQIFQGQFRNDKRCGYGELIKVDGETYRGNFENDMMHGFGEAEGGSSLPIKGYWINGKQVQQDMGVIHQDQLERQQSLPATKRARINRESLGENPKSKKKVAKRSPKASPKRSIEKSLSPEDPDVKRPCGCRRKH